MEPEAGQGQHGPRYAAMSHAGHRRSHNEDSCALFPELGLYVVADGMGGHEAGEVASRIVVDHVAGAVAAGEALERAVAGAHDAVLAAAAGGNGHQGMGSTVVAALLDGDRYRIAWAGDSRAYRMARGLERLTRDHSLVQEMLDQGQINESEARRHPERNLITRAMGMPDQGPVGVETVDGRLGPGQYLLLCSDGLTEELSDDEIKSRLASGEAPDRLVSGLVDAALAAGGRDNITVVLIQAPGEGLGSPRAPAARLAAAAAVGLASALAVALVGRWLGWPWFG